MNKRPSIPRLSRPPRLFSFLFSLFTALALCASAPAETVTIATAGDWAAFANRVNAGETNLNARMIAEVTLSQASPFVGTDTAHPYHGTFDGNGHTLTVNWVFTGATNNVAPFRFVSACTIKNLHVTGTIQSKGKFLAGFIGECLGNGDGLTNHIENCRSSATIVCNISGDATSGGFVALLQTVKTSKIQFDNCLFDGSLLGPNATSCGGFTGFRWNTSYATYYNCLFAPAAVTVSTNASSTFSRNGLDKISNCYYLQAFGTKQGTDASGMSAKALSTALGKKWSIVNGKAALTLFPPVPPAPAANHFTYQGALKTISGEPLTGEKTVDFRIYDQAAGGTPLWARSRAVLLNENGLFNVELSDDVGEKLEGASSSAPLAAILAGASGPLYVGLTVSGSDGEIAPRQRLLSVPYASFAADAASASGDFDVAGELFSAGLDVSGPATISGKVYVKGDAAVKGNLAVAGSISGIGSAPVGAIVLWTNSSKIPDGWALCNGQTNNSIITPNLSDRFVVGAGKSYEVGNTGGTDHYTLSTNQLPAHSHLYAGDDCLTYITPGSTGYSATNNVQETTSGYNNSNGDWGSPKIYRTSAAGKASPDSVDNRPRYHVLCYIMRVK